MERRRSIRTLSFVISTVVGLAVKASVLLVLAVVVVGMFFETSSPLATGWSPDTIGTAVAADGPGQRVVTLVGDLAESPSTFLFRNREGRDLLFVRLQQNGAFLFSVNNGSANRAGGCTTADGSFRVSVSNGDLQQRILASPDGSSAVEVADPLTRDIRRLKITPAGKFVLDDHDRPPGP